MLLLSSTFICYIPLIIMVATFTKTKIVTAAANIQITMDEEVHASLMDPSFREQHKISPVHMAALGNSPNFLLSLLDNGADIESRNGILSTPLHYASLRSNTACLSILLDRGANMEAKDHRGYTPLLIAAKTGNIIALDALLQKGANPLARTNDGIGIFELSSKFPFIHILILSYTTNTIDTTNTTIGT